MIYKFYFLLFALVGCDPETQRMLTVGLDDSNLPTLEELPVGAEALQAWIDADLELHNVEVVQGWRAEKSLTLPTLKQVRYCRTCDDDPDRMLWITSHEIVHIWQFDNGWTMRDYADTSTRFGLELQAGRFSMWVAALAGWRAEEWRISAIDQIQASSLRHELTPREIEIVADILNNEWRIAALETS